VHEMLTIVTDVRGVRLSVTWLKSVVARTMYAACCVCGVIRCSLHQMLLASGFICTCTNELQDRLPDKFGVEENY